jgi:hypothetical protein
MSDQQEVKGTTPADTAPKTEETEIEAEELDRVSGGAPVFEAES